MHKLIQDFRYGLRILVKNRRFTVITILALAVGIGANAAIFSVVNAILFRPLPYKDPSRLVTLWQDHRSRGGPDNEWTSPGNFNEWRKQNQSFDHVVALVGWGPTLTGGAEPEDLIGAAVSHDTFTALGIPPAIGRTFVPDEDRVGAERTVVIGDGLWKRRFASDPNIVGSAMTLGGESYTIIGVMPSGFKFPIIPTAELWRTLTPAVPQGCDQGCIILRAIARLKPNVSVESARADMNTVMANLGVAYPDENSGVGATVVGLQDQIVGQAKPMLLMLLAAVGLVLLIACANVANLMLARASSREREIAIRSALGASRSAIVRQLLVESVLMAVVGGLVGLLVAYSMVALLKMFAPVGTPRIDEVGIDWQVLGFAGALAILTGIVSGLAPALQLSRRNLSNSLGEGKGTGGGSVGMRTRTGLVIAEVAIAIMLLIGAGLLVRSFIKLMAVDPGFNPSGVLTMNIGLPRSRYPERHQPAEFHKTLMERVKALPGVESAGAVSTLPLSGRNTDTNFTIEGRPQPGVGEEPAAWYASVTPDYFRAFGLRLIRGRLITDQDTADAPPVVVISQKLADRYFPDEEPVGKRLGRGGLSGQVTWMQIIGVVADVKQFGLELDARPSIYFPHAQIPARFMTLTVRAPGDLMALATAIRARVSEIDRDLGVSGIRPMEKLRDDSVGPQRFTLLLLMLFAGSAVLLAAIGIYGVISYSVEQRTREIGIRMALGASRRNVLRLVVEQGMRLTLGGIAAGLLSAFGLTRLMQSLLFGVTATDSMTFAVIPVFLILVALMACLLPARRATRVDPMVALRYE